MKVKTYIRQVHKAYRWYRDYVGTWVTWYEYDPARSTKDNIYDESPEAQWKPGFILPVMVVIRDEDRENPNPEGFYTGSTIHLTFGTEMASKAGMNDPLTATPHLKDRFKWDEAYWEVRRYQISGRLKKYEVVIGVDAQKLAAEEMFNQADFPLNEVFFLAGSTAGRSTAHGVLTVV